MKLKADVMGADLVTASLALLEPSVTAHVGDAVQEVADLAVEAVRERVPKRSGELASTIRKASTKDRLVAWVQAGYGTLRRRSRSTGVKGDKRRAKTKANDAPGVYAMVVEYGDAKRNRPAEPYMIPGVESVRPQLEPKIEAALQMAVSDAEAGKTT